MDNIEISNHFKTTSPSFPSPTGTHIAALSGSRLQIRCTSSFEIIRSISIPQSHDVRNCRISWSPPARQTYPCGATPPRRTRVAQANRILIFDDETTRVYDLRDEKWNAIINNGSGGMGKNVHVEFGRTEDEVFIWSDFASKVTVWCLKSGRTVEIKDPKFVGRENKGWGYRPQEEGEGRGGMMAILCRTSGQDVLMLLAPRTYTVIKRVELATMDAAGMKWNRDGRWIAVWESAASGYHLHIYTADGHLYRSISREPSEETSEWGIEGLGVKSVEWIPGNQWLAVGGWDRRVRILSTRTFSPILYLDHTAQIHIPTASVYTENVDGRGVQSYNSTQQPVTPPKATAEKTDTSLKQGISIMAFNNEGTMCVTRDDSTPTTIWIWDLRALRPTTILIQHAPVKSLQWHPHNPALLLIQSVHDHPTIYLFTAQPPSSSPTSTRSAPPEIVNLRDSFQKLAISGPVKWDAKWLSTEHDKKPAIIYGHQQGHVIIWPAGKDQILRFENQDEEDQSDDSLYDILTGRTPVPPLHRDQITQDSDRSMEDSGDFEGVAVDEMQDDAEYGDSSGAFDDTFRGKRRERGVEARGRSVFDESGLDEMF